jgi:Domain of unknown function (DUF5655)
MRTSLLRSVYRRAGRAFLVAKVSSAPALVAAARSMMPTKTQTTSADREAGALFADKDPIARTIYDALMFALRRLGDVVPEPKKSSIHITAGVGTPAFAGVHPRKSGILLNVRTGAPLSGTRVRKTEQVSRNRYHNEILLTAPSDIDDELRGWLAEAHRLASK